MLCKARVNDEHYPVDGERGLGNVRADDNLAADGTVGFVRRGGLEDPLLKVGRQRGIQRNALHVPDLRTEVVYLALDTLTCFLDLFLS